MTQAIAILGRDNLSGVNLLTVLACGQSRTFLISGGVLAQPIVGGTIIGLVVLNSTRKQAEQASEEQASKQHSSMASALAPAFRFLPCLSSRPDFLQW